LDLNGFSQTVASLADHTGGGGTVLNNSALGSVSQLTVGDATSTAFSGIVADGTTGGKIALTKVGSGTLTLSGANSYTGTTLISGGTLMLGNGGTTGSLSPSSNITNNGTLNFNHSDNIVQGSAFGGLITGSGKLVQSGAGSTKLNAANDFLGDTEVTFGTLEAGAEDALKSTANVKITGGTLLLSGSGNRVNNSAMITLSGGTLNSGGFSEAMGTLSIGSGNSVLDLGSGTSSVTFADSSGTTWAGLLAVWNWSGSLSGGGTDQLNFTSAGGLISGQIAAVSFVNPAGLPAGTYGSQLLSTGELVPVPESNTLFVSSLLVGLVGFQSRRKAMQQRNRQRC
jgi:fibronectin-binding autotransporter adhesin